MTQQAITYCLGIPETFRKQAVALYDQAFGQKLSVAISKSADREPLFLKGLQLEYAIGAISGNQLVGLAGFQTADGSLTNGIQYRDLLAQLGFFKSLWAFIIFSLYHREPQTNGLVMDGIVVDANARGLGIGSELLKQVQQFAQDKGYQTVRLDVIDINPRAQKLYERMGFKAIKTESFPYLKGLLGFSGSTTMQFTIS